MKDRRFDPVEQLVSLAWAVLACAALLAVAVYLLRNIWPWLLGIAALALLAVALIRLLTLHRSRKW